MAALSARALLSCAALLLSLVGLSCSTTQEEYCEVCSSNTMCLYMDVGEACKQGSLISGFPEDQKTFIVDYHNKLRNQVALGQETRGNPGPQPAAANMQRLAWDNELADVAQRWTDQCTFEHDECRNVPRFYVGQNLYIWGTSPCDTLDGQPDWASAIDGWYNEVTLMDKNTVSNFQGADGIGHYTQVVWALTSFVGCGFTNYLEGDQCKKYYACNYGPGGNYIDSPVYEEGDTRSACPTSSEGDAQYPGLC